MGTEGAAQISGCGTRTESHVGVKNMGTERQLGLLHVEAEKRAARGWGNVDGEGAGVSL